MFFHMSICGCPFAGDSLCDFDPLDPVGWAPVGPQISLAGLRRCSELQHPPRDGPSAGPQAPRRHPRDLSEAQNSQGLPVPLHNPDPLIDRGARPNPREGNTALSERSRVPQSPQSPQRDLCLLGVSLDSPMAESVAFQGAAC